MYSLSTLDSHILIISIGISLLFQTRRHAAKLQLRTAHISIYRFDFFPRTYQYQYQQPLTMRITTTSTTALLAAASACCLLSSGGTLLPAAEAAQTRRRLGRGRSASQNGGGASRPDGTEGRRLSTGKGGKGGKGSCGGKAGKGSNPGGDDDDDDDCSETPSMSPSVSSAPVGSSAPTIDFNATCVAYAYGKAGGKAGKAGSGKAGKGGKGSTIPPGRRRLKAGSADDIYDSSYEPEVEDERRLSAPGKGGKGSCRGKAGKAGKGGKAGKAGSGKGKVSGVKCLLIFIPYACAGFCFVL